MVRKKTGKRPIERSIGIHHDLPQRTKDREMIAMVVPGVATRAGVIERSDPGATSIDTMTDTMTDSTIDTTIDTTTDTMINGRPIMLMKGHLIRGGRNRDIETLLDQ
jgi:hypothetical protein